MPSTNSEQPASSHVRNCQHIKVTGVPCGGPAMRGELFCYFHQRMLRGVRTPPNVRLHPVALIEDEESIQASLMEIINALARNHIDLRRAELMLKALGIAVKNSRRARFEVHKSRMVREVPDYPAPPRIAPRPVRKKQTATERTAINATAQIQSRALATIAQNAGPAPAPVLVSTANTAPAKAASRQTAPAEALPVDPSQRKPPARAGLPSATRSAAVNQQAVNQQAVNQKPVNQKKERT